MYAHLYKIKLLYRNYLVTKLEIVKIRCGGERVRELRSNDSKFVAVILDCTVLEREIKEPILGTLLHVLESTSRGLCSALHSKRTHLLKPCSIDQQFCTVAVYMFVDLQ